MGKTLIKIDCLDQRLIVASAPTLASGGKNENEVEFNFCEKWNGFEKVAVFYRDVKDPYKSTIDGNGRCVVPWEVLTSDGYIFIGVFGVKDDITRTSEILRYKIKLGAITEDLKPSDPTPELWEQILAGITDKVNVKQGVEHAGKVLGIDEEGNVTPVIGGGSGAILDPTLSKANQAAEAKAVGEALAKKVDSVEGMGLSSNNYTDEEKLKVERNETDIENLSNDLEAFEKNRPFDLTGNPVHIDTFEGMPLNPVTVLEPQQEGSGDPYPAGCGIQLLPFMTLGKTYTAKGLTATVTKEGMVINGTPESDGADVFAERLSLLPGTYFVSGGSPGDTVRLMLAIRRNDGAYNYPVNNSFEIYGDEISITAAILSSGLDKIQDYTLKPMLNRGGTAQPFELYENIRPFVGYDKLDLNAAGKNLLKSYFIPQTVNNVVFTLNSDGKIVANGTASGNIYAFVSASGKDFNLPVGNYVLSGCKPNTGGYYLVDYTYTADGSYIRAYVDSGLRVNIDVFDPTVKHRVQIYIPSGTVLSNVVFEPMIRLASDADATYKLHTGKSYSIQIGRTVYGFRYEWLTGKGLIEWAMKTLNGTENIVKNPGSRGQEDRFVVEGFPNAVEGVGYADRYRLQDWATDDYAFYPAGSQLYIRHKGIESVDAYKAYLSASPSQIAYKLATPVEIQLEPHEINALQGINTLYGDGEITISGRSDMQAVVSNLLKRIATLESKLNESTLSGESE